VVDAKCPILWKLLIHFELDTAQYNIPEPAKMWPDGPPANDDTGEGVFIMSGCLGIMGETQGRPGVPNPARKFGLKLDTHPLYNNGYLVCTQDVGRSRIISGKRQKSEGCR
jgi:hypothetical protein